MIMTEKLYYQNSHLFEFEAVVTDCREAGKKGFAVILDKTAFFPEGGGQLADTGFIGDVRVTDVQETKGEILHYCESVLPVGEKYSCRLDAEQRLVRMQNHSGEHIVSGIAHNLYGCENVGFHMGAEFMTIDFDRELTWEQLQRVETLANETVRANVYVMTWFPGEEELKQLHYRSKLELTEDVRIVEIPGIDRCACCAPHVEQTGEIGLIKIMEYERHRGGVRITLACGMLALADYRGKQESVTNISQLLSAKRDAVATAVERIMAEQLKAKERIAALSMELAKIRAASCGETAGNICLFDNVLDEIAQRELVNMLMEKCGGIAAVFCGSDEEGWRYVIGSRNVDLRKNGKAVNAAINGRGGGSITMIQGRAASTRADIENGILSFAVQT